MTSSGMVIICGPRRGRWTPFRPVREVLKVHGNRKWFRCERCQKRIPVEQAFASTWSLTREEMKKAMQEFDLFSLTVQPRIWCANCVKEAGDAEVQP